MSLAFLITAHQQPEQLAQLLDAIHHPDCTYLLVPDRKSLSGEEPALQAVVNRHPNVRVAPARDLRWASWSLMDARLDGIARLLAHPEPWQTLITLTGQDFPLRPIETIMAEFAANPDRNSLDIHDPLTHWADPYARPYRVRLELPFMKTGFTVPKLRRDRWTPNLGNARYMGGRPYMALSRAFCQHLIDSPKLPAWKKALANSYRPDEVLVHSFIMNSPFAETVHKGMVHAEFWDEGASKPRILTMADREALDKTPEPFARKFDAQVDAGILRHLQQKLQQG